MPTRQIIGLMSGTSCDGLDIVHTEISGSESTLRAEIKAFQTVEYLQAMREKLLRAGEEISARELAVLNFELGEFFADAVLQFLASCHLKPEYFDAVASHGHTICHLSAQNATLQIGESAVIAQRTGITTISDFRVADVAAGGQGAPLVPYADWCLLREASTHRIIQNIGGIANCTLLPANCELENVRAWDTGPGVMILDECVRVLTNGQQQFDEDGKLAAQGRADEDWLRELMKHEYFFRPPPVTCGREEFGKFYATQLLKGGARRGLSTLDVIATATAFTAESIAHSYRMHAAPLLLSDNCEIILGGGGALNPTLRRMLQSRLTPHRVLTHEDVGLRSDAKEALAFAILAHETLDGTPSNVPSATGARRAVVLGKIAYG
jgi:anhydro-N-acetylmuramic acid kinase